MRPRVWTLGVAILLGTSPALPFACFSRIASAPKRRRPSGSSANSPAMQTLRRAVADFAKAARLKIDWTHVRFPNAMVDRITPATTDAVRADCNDPMAVPTEAFREWVIENNFAGPHPDWPGVQFVQDVRPHELRKLRMLNGAHSFLAYAGLTQGYSYVHEAISDLRIRSHTKQLMLDAGATLPDAVRGQVPDYAKALLARFDNPELAHRLDQIAMDGSQKLPYRFLDTLREGGSPMLIQAVRTWMNFCQEQTEKGITIKIKRLKQNIENERN